MHPDADSGHFASTNSFMHGQRDAAAVSFRSTDSPIHFDSIGKTRAPLPSGLRILQQSLQAERILIRLTRLLRQKDRRHDHCAGQRYVIEYYLDVYMKS